MSPAVLISASAWTWIVALVLLATGGYLFLNKLIRKGVYDEKTDGRSGLSGALSEMQTVVDPAHQHVIEEQERKRAEHDDAADGEA